MKVGGAVRHPRRPDLQLLSPGIVLDAKLINRLRCVGIRELWVEHDAAADLDLAMVPHLDETRLALYEQVRADFSQMSAATVTTAHVQTYRQTVSGLVLKLIGSHKYARLSSQMLAKGDRFFSHCINVAYLTVLVGLELKSYIVQQRNWIEREDASDMVTLGLAAVMHDIGKITLSPEAREHHEIDTIIDGAEQTEPPTDYREHPAAGKELLNATRIEPSARHAVLHHHQRFDGEGWPDMTDVTGGRRTGTQRGNDLHIFTRILAAANVLDNLLHAHEMPPVRALYELAGDRFDGWFDPIVRGMLLRRLPPFPISSLVHLNTGEQAVVLTPNVDQPCRPAIRLLADEHRDNEGQHRIINLHDHPPEEFRIVGWGGQDVEPWLFTLPQLSRRPSGSTCP